jgi:RND superfamily putative drug exporter
MFALAGLLLTGLSVFTSMALGTIVVVAFAVIGSVTVLPATLALLGDRVNKGRLPFLHRLRGRRAGRSAWARLAGTVTRRPLASLVCAVCLLAALAVPALDMRAANSGLSALPADTPVLVAERAIERAFPGAPSDAQLVVSSRDLDSPVARQRLRDLGERAREITRGRGSISIDVSSDGRTAVVAVPMPDRGVDAAEKTVAQLRASVGSEALVTGMAAGNADFTQRLTSRTPLVIAAVLGLAMLLLIAAFRSPALAASVVGLNLLSVGAAYGVLVAVFQNEWAESLLGFTSSGTIADWLPLFAFVILFGLSMDYTILVLERIREARLNGRSPREAAREGVAATASTVTSAAIVMVAVFAIFATMRFTDNKELGVGLAAAILLDATIVRGVALPAVVSLLGERGWRVRPRRASAPGWDDGRPARIATATPVGASSRDAR